jgi:DNA polymerase-2
MPRAGFDKEVRRKQAGRVLEAFLLTRSWRDARGGRAGVELELWGRSPRGPVRIRISGHRPVFFVERQVQTTSGERRPVELTSLLGRPVDAVYFDSQRDLVRERERLLDDNRQPLEADVKPVDRFLMERFITGACAIEGELHQREGFLETVDPILGSSDHVADLSVASFDIETDHRSGRVLSIATVMGARERVYIVGSGAPPPDTELVADERALLKAFVALVRELDPDVLLGWNLVDFDLQHLLARARALGLRLALGRGGGSAEVLPPRTRSQPAVARIPGRVVLDGIATLRSATYGFESFALEDVARELLGRGKRIGHVHDRADEIVRLHAEDPTALAAYNLEDCRLVLDIFAHTDLLDFAMARQRLTGLPMDRQGGAVAAFDHLYLPRLHRHGHVAPSVGQSDEVVTSPGGYVLDSIPGLFNHVLVLDFKSLYPSIIRTFCIDPMGLAFPGKDPVEGFDGAHFARERHILPGLIETLWAARDGAKQRGDAARSQAIKILMNSFYGVLGTPGCRFFNPKLASSITRRGHRIIRESQTHIEKRGLRVIYGDTDSLFVLLGDGHTPQQCRVEGEMLAQELNAMFAQRLRGEMGLESQLEVEFEVHYERFFMPTMRHSERGTKKRYAGIARAADGRRELVIKGLEAVRSDWTPLARSFQRELLRRVLMGEPYEDYVRELTDALFAGDLDAQLVYRKRLRRDVSEYVKNVPPHVQAARQLENPGRHVQYVMTTAGPQPASMQRAALDYDHYLQRQLAPAADGILHFLGTDLMRLGGRQMSLF